MKPLLVTSGEPAGIGPDLCLKLCALRYPLVVLGDKQLLMQRAEQLELAIEFDDYQPFCPPHPAPNRLTVLSIPCPVISTPGVLNPQNAGYVMQMLTMAAAKSASGEFSALVTAPVHKAIINQAGTHFTGHTEFFADYFNVKQAVMLLVCPVMKVALVTTHVPLNRVAESVTPTVLSNVILTLNEALKKDFGILRPKIYVAGLNPHAGEAGYLGHEELSVIIPTLMELKQQGIDLEGPFPADTMFTPRHVLECDVFLTMYHDQGLPVLKYAGFGQAVNVTLGLPIIRTSVDHGTALELSGTGEACFGSLIAAVELAAEMVKHRGDL